MRTFSWLLTVALVDADDMASMMGGGGMDMASMMGGGMGGPPPPVGYPPVAGVQADVPLILCATCKQLVKRSFFVTKGLRDALKKTQLSEEAILEKLVGDHKFDSMPTSAPGGVCNPDAKDGEWLHAFDMQEAEDGTVALKKMPVAGECGVECRTVAMACAEALAEIDDPLAVALYKNAKTSKQLEAEACGAVDSPGWASSLEGACHKPKMSAPAGRATGEAFQVKQKAEEPPPPAPKGKKKKKKKKASKSKEEL